VVATPQALITADTVETYATDDMAALRAALTAQ
jgi:ribose transport system substrate-binding protein